MSDLSQHGLDWKSGLKGIDLVLHCQMEGLSNPHTFLKVFRRHDLASLWDIAQKHDIDISFSTATAPTLRRAILFHLATGERMSHLVEAYPNIGCMVFSNSIWNQKKERELWGVDVDKLRLDDQDLESVLYRLRVLIVLKNSLSRLPPALPSDLPTNHRRRADSRPKRRKPTDVLSPGP